MSYLGLQGNVRYRIEIGLAYIDDGTSVHRFDQALFGELRAAIPLPAADGTIDAVSILLKRFPSVFCSYEDRTAAERSFDLAELPEALAS